MMQKIHKTFYKHIQVEKYKSILALNGELPDKSFFDNNLPIIAADGAANTLHKMDINPQIIIGDLDSVNPQLLKNTKFLHVLDQNRSDFEKALDHIKQSNLLPSIILGINGGFIDHILNNISILISTGGIFYSPPIVGHVLQKANQTAFTLPINTKISLIGMPEAILSTTGLKWELHHHKLSCPGHNSCFNRTTHPDISINLHSGTCLIMIYLEEMCDSGKDCIL